jgi:hypothetical protein
MLPWLSVLVLLGAVYDGWIFYGRWQSNRAAERARADAEAERARKTVQAIGGLGFGIRNFYASPAVIHRGQPVTICYSVTGATTLRLDPPVAEVYPTFNHCVQASPRQDTEFTLTAGDAAGHAATAKLVLKVER